MSKSSPISITLAALVAGCLPAFADASTEVMHFRSTGGKAADLATMHDKVQVEAVSWIGAPVAGGGRDQVKTALRARIAGGKPSAAMLPLGQKVRDCAAEWQLGDVDALAATPRWDAVLPQAVQAFAKVVGPYVRVPTNVHRTGLMGASKAAFEEISAACPTTRDELNALAPRFAEVGIILLTHGGQAWQEAYRFEAVAARADGADFYRCALVDLDDAAPRGPEMAAAFIEMATTHRMVDPNVPERDWTPATATVVIGEAVIQIMGDWAKGKFTNARKGLGIDFACIPDPKAKGVTFVYLANPLTQFAQTDPEQACAQEVLASIIMDPSVQLAFDLAKGAIPARNDVDASALDTCAQATQTAFSANNVDSTVVPTFAATHPKNAAIVEAGTDVVTNFFNSDVTPDDDALANVTATTQ